jgi:hypothetical protein
MDADDMVAFDADIAHLLIVMSLPYLTSVILGLRRDR